MQATRNPCAAAGTADVAATIKWAASCGLDLAVKGGGHGAVSACLPSDDCLPAS